MFRFKALELMNWDCYPHYRVPLNGDIILLIGQNGSGKTTFLDALRALLNSTRLSKGRTLHHYIKKDVEVAMIKGVVTNTLVGNRRPFAHLGIYGDVDVSLICLIHNKGPQKIEKEFYIVKGDVSTEDVKKLKGGLKPLQYSRQLEEAGVSRSTLKLIALEQGETDRIGQLTPGEMLQLVMDITGNREIIKGYEEARRNYKRSSQQLIELRTEYNKICQQNVELERQAKQAEAYKELLDERDIIEQEKLPLSRWYKILTQIHDIQNDHLNINEKKIALEKRTRVIDEDKSLIHGKIESVEQEQAKIKEKQTEYDRRLRQLHQEIGQCNSEWNRLDTLRKDCEKIPEDFSIENIQKELEEYQEVYYQCKNKLAEEEKSYSHKQKELAVMQKNKLPTYPRDIYEIRDVLERAKIENLLFAECLEITDPKWQLAIEAFLGRERFSIFVSNKDYLKAKKYGEQHKYGYYISPYNDGVLPSHIKNNSILANIKIQDERIRGRLTHLNDIILVDTIEEGHKYKQNISITVKGYRQDKRGGIFIAKHVKFYCGGLAMEQQLALIEEEIEQQSDVIMNLQIQLQDTSKKMRELENQLKIYKKKEQWENAKEVYDGLKEKGQELVQKSEIVSNEKDEILVDFDKLSEQKTKELNALQQLETEKFKIEREKKQIEETVYEKEQILSQLKWQKEDLDKQIPKETKNVYTPEQLENTEWLEKKLEELSHHIEMFPGCRELALINLYKHEEKQLQSKSRQLERQEEDQKQRSQELEKCREDYKDMIVGIISFYNKAVKELANLAGCKLRVFLELGKGEALIENAKLFVKVAFDQKHEVNIRDKSLSGGQDVISSLILLVALSRIEQEGGSGFFIMDEHNAHLDMLRIIEVGRFLRSTKAQFVLTTPTTENLAALSVADLTITFTKKMSQKGYAAKPRYMRRM